MTVELIAASVRVTPGEHPGSLHIEALLEDGRTAEWHMGWCEIPGPLLMDVPQHVVAALPPLPEPVPRRRWRRRASSGWQA